jgi:NADH:ubiquinone oxidoreductase subunit E/CheY-like chemotaxis protein
LIELVVLILEKEAGRISELENALTKESYTVRLASDGASLLSDLATGSAHLVVLDLDLPHKEGMAILKAAHDAQPRVPIICETAKPTVESAVEAMRRGAYNYTSKFGPVSTLMDMISHAVEKERMEVETKERAKERRIRTFDDPASLEAIDEILTRHRFSESMIISYLQDIQKELNYLPQEAIRFVARRINVSLPRVYGIATFYKTFSLIPRGRHIINVCLGTACHVRGGANLLLSFERELGISAGETTYDNRFSLESVRCVGCCGLAPVFIIDGKFYGKMTQEKIPQILDAHE